MSITKKTSVKNFFKDNTDLRIGTEAIETMLSKLDELCLGLVKKAESSCLAEERTTIMERDIEEAFKSIGGSVQENPQGLFQAIEKMNPEQIGKISLLIADWVKQNRR